MAFFSKSKGILGMNARNLLYISRYNSKTDKRFADDKIYTKNFLSSRNIGVAKVFTIIRNYKELRHVKPADLPENFVIKPNRGYAGEGIIVVTGTQGGKYLDAGGNRLTWDDLYQNMVAILEGKYAISGLRDTVIIEERLLPHDYFRPFVEYGLPDIRIIVFNLVPVVAMLRLPTAESKGKANLHLGAIGLGIDLGGGKTTYGVRHNHFITRMPMGSRVNELVVPEWNQIMLTAATCQKVSSIGYLAVDIALTNKGIKVLELNARAGLSVQIANRVYLRSRLEKIADLEVLSPEKGVEIAQTLFATRGTPTADDMENTVLGMYEPVRVLNARAEHVTAKIDPWSEMTVLDDRVTLKHDDKVLDLHIKNQRVKLPFTRARLPTQDYRLIIAGKHLTGFLLDLGKTDHLNRANPRGANAEKMLENLDKKLASIAARVNLLSHLRPVNLDSQRALFLEHPTHSPHFVYRPLTLDVTGLRRDLNKLHRDIDHPLTPLFEGKISEIEQQLTLIENRCKPNFSGISRQLYGLPDEHECMSALQYMTTHPLSPDTSKVLTSKQVKKRIELYLAKHAISGWSITLTDESIADMHINKKGSIFIRKSASVSENRLRSLIVHEVETHVYRRDNGRLQPYRIFEYGTASYLETEEGLAIYNQEQSGTLHGTKQLRFAWYIVALYHGARMGFAELFHTLTTQYNIPPADAVHLCFKVKRGLADTDRPGVFTKDRVYFAGWRRVHALVAQHGLEAIHGLYMGKISIDNLTVLSHLATTTPPTPIKFSPPRHLPTWLKKSLAEKPQTPTR